MTAANPTGDPIERHGATPEKRKPPPTRRNLVGACHTRLPRVSKGLFPSTPPRRTMKFAHQFIDIACSYDDAMDLFSDPDRLPEWAIAYCQGVQQTPEGHVAETVEGLRCFKVRADRETGVTDVRTGSSHDALDDILHVRVVPGGPDLTLVSFVYAPPGEVPAEVTELMQTGLLNEAEHAKQLLEGAISER